MLTTIEMPKGLFIAATDCALTFFPEAGDADDHPAFTIANVDEWHSLAVKLFDAQIAQRTGTIAVRLTGPELAAFQAAFEMGSQEYERLTDAECDVITDLLTV